MANLRAVATRVVAVFPRFFFNGLPPVVGLCGESLRWETKLCSVSNRLHTAHAVQGLAYGLFPSLANRLGFAGLLTGGSALPRTDSRSMLPNRRKISAS